MLKHLHILVICIWGLLVFFSFYKEANNLLPKKFEYNTNNLKQSFNDGPYLFIKEDKIISHTIINGKLQTKELNSDSVATNFNSEPSLFKNVNKIAAFSDLHGQYDLTIKILKNNNIIDENSSWIYGDGHLVIVGDIFDRGQEVTELLWFVYNLEKQALNGGGRIHYVLGNHEFMVMQNDLRYINKKYTFSSSLMNTSYNELFGKETVLGRWLRSKSTILKIDTMLFVHGGISPGFIDEGLNIDEFNEGMRQSLYDDISMESDSINDKYFNSYGPIWYRGYFSEDFKKNSIKKLLKKLDVEHIIVGHTSQTQIENLFDNRIFAVDSSIKNGTYGEILLIENGNFYRGTMDGEKIKLNN